MSLRVTKMYQRVVIPLTNNNNITDFGVCVCAYKQVLTTHGGTTDLSWMSPSPRTGVGVAQLPVAGTY